MSGWREALESALPWLAAGSLASLVLVAVAVPIIVIELPADYFARRDRSQFPFHDRHPLLFVPLLVVKNLAAVTCIVIGAALLLLPGQGLLTILVGVLLLDFPGKYRLERWLVSRRRILHLFNRIRERAGRAPFHIVDQGGR